MTPEQSDALRKPFPANVIGKLPKAGRDLDYVGHAAVTDRLLSIDPAWTWEPVALGTDGLPAYQNGGLWIRLTVCGVTRLGFGDGPDPKQRISDAIRNAAMRFGVALDLWTKDELEGDPTSRTWTPAQFHEKHPQQLVSEATLPEPESPVGVEAAPPSAAQDGVDFPSPSEEELEAAQRESTAARVEALRLRVEELLGSKDRRHAMADLTRVNLAAGKEKLMNELVQVEGGAISVAVFLDNALKSLSRAS